jgi:DNA (cytosine-5)-methyltransferase 1
VFFSEVDRFPKAVLAHRYPDVPDLGDMTEIDGARWRGEVDVLIGGTPCQSFSVAGQRRGMEDPRGNLTVKFVDLCDLIQPDFIVWENVPGVLSDRNNAFGCFLGAMAGEDEPLQPAGKRWTNAGYVLGPERAIAWRTLDAQYFGVAQRRRRVFLVACPGDGADPREVLFEREGVRRDTAPRREAGEGAASGAGECALSFRENQRAEVELVGGDGATVQALSNGGGKPGQGYPAVACFGGGTAELTGDTATALRASQGGGDKPHVTHSLRADGFDASEDGTGRGTPLVPVAHTPAVAFTCKDYGADAGDSSPTLRAMGHDGSHANAGGQVAVQQDAAVRRLTPREAERLQGFPDDYTAIPYRNGTAADGPRYKALGNSMAVPVVRWVCKRIERSAG